MTTTPPGWYDDGHGALRWWDGAAWTEHVHTPDTPAEAEPPVATEAPDGAGAEAPPAAAPAAASAAPESAAPGPDALMAPASDTPPAADPGSPGPGQTAGYLGQAAGYSGQTAGYPGQAAGYSGQTAYPGQAAYPGQRAYPGQPGPPAPNAPTQKSRLWILWVVLGGIVLLMIVLAAILIPLAVGWFTSAPASGDDQARAVEAVELYDDAWDDADCDAYERSTTAEYREGIELTDCASFEADAQSFGDSTDDYELEVTGVEVVDAAQIEVVTLETYLRLYDDAGELLADPQPVEESLRYVVVADGDRWAIDGLDYDE